MAGNEGLAAAPEDEHDAAALERLTRTRRKLITAVLALDPADVARAAEQAAFEAVALVKQHIQPDGTANDGVLRGIGAGRIIAAPGAGRLRVTVALEAA